jgi:hypothetical protein
MSGMDEQQCRINESMARAPTRQLEAAAVALLKLAEYNIPVDVQELLINGNPSRGIRPGAFVAALSVAIGSYMRLDGER